MGLFDKILRWIRSLSDYRQPVYDPNYDGSSWRKWILVFLVLLVGVIIFFALSNRQADKTEYSNNRVTTTNEPEQKNTSIPQQQTTLHEVVRVIDGDTIEIRSDDGIRKVRMIGIDTPEKNHPSKPVECFAKEASDHLSQLISGKSVSVEADTSQDTRDKYNRYLYYIFLNDQNINLQMISDGYAYEYTYNTPYKYQNDFKKAQIAASEADKGLWSPSSCNGERVAPSSSATSNAANTASRAAGGQSTDCDPNYTPCVPNVSYDLDCGDISFSVRVVGNDHHRFDREGDGYGCESNG